MPFLKTYQKSIATFAAVCFLASLITAPPQAFAQPHLGEISLGETDPSLSFVPLGIPAELASIDEVFIPDPKKSQAAPLIHIQSVHAHPETQRKIYGLLKFLDEKYGVGSLFIEGAGENLNPNYFRFFDENRLNVRVAEKLVEKGELTGAELFLIESEKDIPAYGIEDVSLYRENLTAFQNVMFQRPLTSHFTDETRKVLDRLETLLLQPEARKLLRSSEAFDAGNLELLSYVLELERRTKALLGIDLRHYESQFDWPQMIRLLRLQEVESGLDPEKIQTERQKLIGFLREIQIDPLLVESFENLAFSPVQSGMVYDPGFRQSDLPRYLAERLVAATLEKGFSFDKYPYFTRYLEAAILQSELEAGRLFDELERLLETLVRAAAKREEEWTLAGLVHKERLFERLFDLELTPKDYTKIEAENQDPRPLVRFLINIESLHEKTPLGAKRLVPENIEAIELIYSEATHFYELAKEREQTMVDKVLEKIQETPSPSSPSSSLSLGAKGRGEGKSPVTILITGGFHTEGLSRAFRKRQVPYTIVSPRITEKVSAEAYVSMLLGEKKTAFDVQYLENVAGAQSTRLVRQYPRDRRQAIFWGRQRMELEAEVGVAGEEGIPSAKFVVVHNRRRSKLLDPNRWPRLVYDPTDHSIIPYVGKERPLPNANGRPFRIKGRLVREVKERFVPAQMAEAFKGRIATEVGASASSAVQRNTQLPQSHKLRKLQLRDRESGASNLPSLAAKTTNRVESITQKLRTGQAVRRRAERQRIPTQKSRPTEAWSNPSASFRQRLDGWAQTWDDSAMTNPTIAWPSTYVNNIFHYRQPSRAEARQEPHQIALEGIVQRGLVAFENARRQGRDFKLSTPVREIGLAAGLLTPSSQFDLVQFAEQLRQLQSQEGYTIERQASNLTRNAAGDWIQNNFPRYLNEVVSTLRQVTVSPDQIGHLRNQRDPGIRPELLRLIEEALRVALAVQIRPATEGPLDAWSDYALNQIETELRRAEVRVAAVDLSRSGEILEFLKQNLGFEELSETDPQYSYLKNFSDRRVITFAIDSTFMPYIPEVLHILTTQLLPNLNQYQEEAITAHLLAGYVGLAGFEGPPDEDRSASFHTGVLTTLRDKALILQGMFRGRHQMKHEIKGIGIERILLESPWADVEMLEIMDRWRKASSRPARKRNYLKSLIEGLSREFGPTLEVTQRTEIQKKIQAGLEEIILPQGQDEALRIFHYTSDYGDKEEMAAFLRAAELAQGAGMSRNIIIFTRLTSGLVYTDEKLFERSIHDELLSFLQEQNGLRRINFYDLQDPNHPHFPESPQANRLSRIFVVNLPPVSSKTFNRILISSDFATAAGDMGLRYLVTLAGQHLGPLTLFFPHLYSQDDVFQQFRERLRPHRKKSKAVRRVLAFLKDYFDLQNPGVTSQARDYEKFAKKLSMLILNPEEAAALRDAMGWFMVGDRNVFNYIHSFINAFEDALEKRRGLQAKDVRRNYKEYAPPAGLGIIPLDLEHHILVPVLKDIVTGYGDAAFIMQIIMAVLKGLAPQKNGYANPEGKIFIYLADTEKEKLIQGLRRYETVARGTPAAIGELTFVVITKDEMGNPKAHFLKKVKGESIAELAHKVPRAEVRTEGEDSSAKLNQEVRNKLEQRFSVKITLPDFMEVDPEDPEVIVISGIAERVEIAQLEISSKYPDYRFMDRSRLPEEGATFKSLILRKSPPIFPIPTEPGALTTPYQRKVMMISAIIVAGAVLAATASYRLYELLTQKAPPQAQSVPQAGVEEEEEEIDLSELLALEPNLEDYPSFRKKEYGNYTPEIEKLESLQREVDRHLDFRLDEPEGKKSPRIVEALGNWPEDLRAASEALDKKIGELDYDRLSPAIRNMTHIVREGRTVRGDAEVLGVKSQLIIEERVGRVIVTQRIVIDGQPIDLNTSFEDMGQRAEVIDDVLQALELQPQLDQIMIPAGPIIGAPRGSFGGALIEFEDKEGKRDEIPTDKIRRAEVRTNRIEEIEKQLSDDSGGRVREETNGMNLILSEGLYGYGPNRGRIWTLSLSNAAVEKAVPIEIQLSPASYLKSGDGVDWRNQGMKAQRREVIDLFLAFSDLIKTSEGFEPVAVHFRAAKDLVELKYSSPSNTAKQLPARAEVRSQELQAYVDELHRREGQILEAAQGKDEKEFVSHLVDLTELMTPADLTDVDKGLLASHTLWRIFNQGARIRGITLSITLFFDPSRIPEAQALFVKMLGRFAKIDPAVELFLNGIVKNGYSLNPISRNPLAVAAAEEALENPVEPGIPPTQDEDRQRILNVTAKQAIQPTTPISRRTKVKLGRVAIEIEFNPKSEGVAELVITSGGSEIYKTTRGPIRIGRDPAKNDLVLKNDQVSRQHAVIEEKDGVWTLKDLDSKNGTRVNGERVYSVVLYSPPAPGTVGGERAEVRTEGKESTEKLNQEVRDKLEQRFSVKITLPDFMEVDPEDPEVIVISGMAEKVEVAQLEISGKYPDYRFMDRIRLPEEGATFKSLILRKSPPIFPTPTEPGALTTPYQRKVMVISAILVTGAILAATAGYQIYALLTQKAPPPAEQKMEIPQAPVFGIPEGEEDKPKIELKDKGGRKDRIILEPILRRAETRAEKPFKPLSVALAKFAAREIARDTALVFPAEEGLRFMVGATTEKEALQVQGGRLTPIADFYLGETRAEKEKEGPVNAIMRKSYSISIWGGKITVRSNGTPVWVEPYSAPSPRAEMRGWLTLTRKEGEKIALLREGRPVVLITVQKIQENGARLIVKAPEPVRIQRMELIRAYQEKRAVPIDLSLVPGVSLEEAGGFGLDRKFKEEILVNGNIRITPLPNPAYEGPQVQVRVAIEAPRDLKIVRLGPLKSQPESRRRAEVRALDKETIRQFIIANHSGLGDENSPIKLHVSSQGEDSFHIVLSIPEKQKEILEQAMQNLILSIQSELQHWPDYQAVLAKFSVKDGIARGLILRKAPAKVVTPTFVPPQIFPMQAPTKAEPQKRRWSAKWVWLIAGVALLVTVMTGIFVVSQLLGTRVQDEKVATKQEGVRPDAERGPPVAEKPQETPLPPVETPQPPTVVTEPPQVEKPEVKMTPNLLARTRWGEYVGSALEKDQENPEIQIKNIGNDFMLGMIAGVDEGNNVDLENYEAVRIIYKDDDEDDDPAAISLEFKREQIQVIKDRLRVILPDTKGEVKTIWVLIPKDRLTEDAAATLFGLIFADGEAVLIDIRLVEKNLDPNLKEKPEKKPEEKPKPEVKPMPQPKEPEKPAVEPEGKRIEIPKENSLLNNAILRQAYQDTYRGLLALRSQSNGMPYNQTTGPVTPTAGWIKSGDIGFMWTSDIIAAANHGQAPVGKDSDPRAVTERIRASLKLYARMVNDFGLRVDGRQTGILPEVLVHRGSYFTTEEQEIPGRPGERGIIYASYDMGLTTQRLMLLAEVFEGGIVPGLQDREIADLADQLLNRTSYHPFVDGDGLHMQVSVTKAGQIVLGPGLIDNKHTEAKLFLPLIQSGMLGDPADDLKKRIADGDATWDGMFFRWISLRVGKEQILIAQGDGSTWTEFYGNLFYKEAELAPRSEGVSHTNYVRAGIEIGNEEDHKIYFTAPGTGKVPDSYFPFGLEDNQVTVPVGPYLALTTGDPETMKNVEQLIKLARSTRSYTAGWGLPDAVDPKTGRAFPRNQKRLFMNQALQLEGGVGNEILRTGAQNQSEYPGVVSEYKELDEKHPAPRSEVRAEKGIDGLENVAARIPVGTYNNFDELSANLVEAVEKATASTKSPTAIRKLIAAYGFSPDAEPMQFVQHKLWLSRILWWPASWFPVRFVNQNQLARILPEMKWSRMGLRRVSGPYRAELVKFSAHLQSQRYMILITRLDTDSENLPSVMPAPSRAEVRSSTTTLIGTTEKPDRITSRKAVTPVDLYNLDIENPEDVSRLFKSRLPSGGYFLISDGEIFVAFARSLIIDTSDLAEFVKTDAVIKEIVDDLKRDHYLRHPNTRLIEYTVPTAWDIPAEKLQMIRRQIEATNRGMNVVFIPRHFQDTLFETIEPTPSMERKGVFEVRITSRVESAGPSADARAEVRAKQGATPSRSKLAKTIRELHQKLAKYDAAFMRDKGITTLTQLRRGYLYKDEDLEGYYVEAGRRVHRDKEIVFSFSFELKDPSDFVRVVAMLATIPDLDISKMDTVSVWRYLEQQGVIPTEIKADLPDLKLSDYADSLRRLEEDLRQNRMDSRFVGQVVDLYFTEMIGLGMFTDLANEGHVLLWTNSLRRIIRDEVDEVIQPSERHFLKGLIQRSKRLIEVEEGAVVQKRVIGIVGEVTDKDPEAKSFIQEVAGGKAIGYQTNMQAKDLAGQILAHRAEPMPPLQTWEQDVASLRSETRARPYVADTWPEYRALSVDNQLTTETDGASGKVTLVWKDTRKPATNLIQLVLGPAGVYGHTTQEKIDAYIASRAEVRAAGQGVLDPDKVIEALESRFQEIQERLISAAKAGDVVERDQAVQDLETVIKGMATSFGRLRRQGVKIDKSRLRGLGYAAITDVSRTHIKLENEEYDKAYQEEMEKKAAGLLRKRDQAIRSLLRAEVRSEEALLRAIRKLNPEDIEDIRILRAFGEVFMEIASSDASKGPLRIHSVELQRKIREKASKIVEIEMDRQTSKRLKHRPRYTTPLHALRNIFGTPYTKDVEAKNYLLDLLSQDQQGKWRNPWLIALILDYLTTDTPERAVEFDVKSGELSLSKNYVEKIKSEAKGAFQPKGKSVFATLVSLGFSDFLRDVLSENPTAFGPLLAEAFRELIEKLEELIGRSPRAEVRAEIESSFDVKRFKAQVADFIAKNDVGSLVQLLDAVPDRPELTKKELGVYVLGELAKLREDPRRVHQFNTAYGAVFNKIINILGETYLIENDLTKYFPTRIAETVALPGVRSELRAEIPVLTSRETVSQLRAETRITTPDATIEAGTIPPGVFAPTRDMARLFPGLPEPKLSRLARFIRENLPPENQDLRIATETARRFSGAYRGRPNPIVNVLFTTDRELAPLFLEVLKTMVNEGIQTPDRLMERMKEILPANTRLGALLRKLGNEPAAHAIIFDHMPSDAELWASVLLAIFNPNFFVELHLTPGVKISTDELAQLEAKIEGLVKNARQTQRVMVYRPSSDMAFEDLIEDTRNRIYRKAEAQKVAISDYKDFVENHVALSTLLKTAEAMPAIEKAVGKAKLFFFGFAPEDVNYDGLFAASTFLVGNDRRGALDRDNRTRISRRSENRYVIERGSVSDIADTFFAAWEAAQVFFVAA